MVTRYTDMDAVTSGAKDFIIRRRAPSATQLLAIFLSALLISVSVTVAVMDKTALVTMLVILLGSVGWYVIVLVQRSRDMMLTTEFQNSLFASALGINNKFCLIIKRDGSIIYLDRSFQEVFPDYLKQAGRSLDTLLEYGRVARPDRDKINSALDRGVYDKVIFNIRGSDGKFLKIVMSIEPILRPAGFTLLRGREYIESRAGEESGAAAAANNLMNKSSITLFSYVMDTMNMGVYMTDPRGNIVYANPILEHWLGFQDGEVSSNNLSLQDIIHQGSNRSDTIEPDNYEGEVALLRKGGMPMKAFINQKVIRDDQKKVMGCTALVHNVADSDTKKKLW